MVDRGIQGLGLTPIAVHSQDQSRDITIAKYGEFTNFIVTNWNTLAGVQSPLYNVPVKAYFFSLLVRVTNPREIKNIFCRQ
jgi:hypothetical protein